MESDLNKQHPFIQLLSTLDEKGVVVTDSVEGIPVNEESYVSPDMLIILCHQGRMLFNDSPQLTFKAHDVAILLPNQLGGFSQQPSADYRTTWIAISKKFHDRLQHSYPYTRYAPRYRRHPITPLPDLQYQSLCHVIELLRPITQSKSIHRDEMLSNLISIILNIIGECHARNQTATHIAFRPTNSCSTVSTRLLSSTIENRTKWPSTPAFAAFHRSTSPRLSKGTPASVLKDGLPTSSPPAPKCCSIPVKTIPSNKSAIFLDLASKPLSHAFSKEKPG